MLSLEERDIVLLIDLFAEERYANKATKIERARKRPVRREAEVSEGIQDGGVSAEPVVGCVRNRGILTGSRMRWRSEMLSCTEGRMSSA